MRRRLHNQYDSRFNINADYYNCISYSDCCMYATNSGNLTNQYLCSIENKKYIIQQIFTIRKARIAHVASLEGLMALKLS